MNIQDWFPLGWTGWISLQSKGLSRVFSNTTVQKYPFFGAQLSLQSSSHIHTWLLENYKNISGSSVLHSLQEFAQIHVHWVNLFYLECTVEMLNIRHWKEWHETYADSRVRMDKVIFIVPDISYISILNFWEITLGISLHWLLTNYSHLQVIPP